MDRRCMWEKGVISPKLYDIRSISYMNKPYQSLRTASITAILEPGVRLFRRGGT